MTVRPHERRFSKEVTRCAANRTSCDARASVRHADPMLRLKQALEVFPAGDGSVYLLRDGYLAEFVIDDVDEQRLALLTLLERPRTFEDICIAGATF